MTKYRIANQHHATIGNRRQGSSAARATSSHPLGDHIEDVLDMVQIITSI